jgi:hypothetical protein
MGSPIPPTGRPVGGPAGGGTDLRALFKDRRFQVAAGAVAVVGAVVLVMRSKSSAASSDAAAAATGTKGYVQGGADTTGTDIASYLGNWGSLQDQRFADFLAQIKAGTPAPGTGVGPTPGTSLGKVTGVHDSNATTSSINLSWNPIEGATGYKIRNYAAPDMAYSVSGNTPNYQVTDLIHNGSYFWQVAAIGPDGTVGSWSDYLTSHTKN